MNIDDYKDLESKSSIEEEERNNLEKNLERIDKKITQEENKVKMSIQQMEDAKADIYENYGAFLDSKKSREYSEKNLNHLKEISNTPYFGHMYLEEKEHDEDVFIGKELITDDKGNTIVYSWASKVTGTFYEPFYKFSYNGYDYTVVYKRETDIQNRRLVHVSERYNADDESSKNISDYFLRKVLREKKAHGEFTDIIESIQEKQNKIIRSDLNTNIICQGVAGSGKTVIIGHRLYYLMFNNSDLNLKSFLYLVPSENLRKTIEGLNKQFNLDELKEDTLFEYYIEKFNRYYNYGQKEEKYISIIDNENDVDPNVVYSEEFLDSQYDLVNNKMIESIKKYLDRFNIDVKNKSFHELSKNIIKKINETINIFDNVRRKINSNVELLKNNNSSLFKNHSIPLNIVEPLGTEFSNLKEALKKSPDLIEQLVEKISSDLSSSKRNYTISSKKLDNLYDGDIEELKNEIKNDKEIYNNLLEEKEKNALSLGELKTNKIFDKYSFDKINSDIKKLSTKIEKYENDYDNDVKDIFSDNNINYKNPKLLDNNKIIKVLEEQKEKLDTSKCINNIDTLNADNISLSEKIDKLKEDNIFEKFDCNNINSEIRKIDNKIKKFEIDFNENTENFIFIKNIKQKDNSIKNIYQNLKNTLKNSQKNYGLLIEKKDKLEKSLFKTFNRGRIENINNEIQDENIKINTLSSFFDAYSDEIIEEYELLIISKNKLVDINDKIDKYLKNIDDNNISIENNQKEIDDCSSKIKKIELFEKKYTNEYLNTYNSLLNDKTILDDKAKEISLLKKSIDDNEVNINNINEKLVSSSEIIDLVDKIEQYKSDIKLFEKCKTNLELFGMIIDPIDKISTKYNEFYEKDKKYINIDNVYNLNLSMLSLINFLGKRYADVEEKFYSELIKIIDETISDIDSLNYEEYYNAKNDVDSININDNPRSVMNESILLLFSNRYNLKNIGQNTFYRNDIVSILYILNKMNYSKLTGYKYIYIDEAQDYNDVEIKIIKELEENPTMCIFGDYKQNITNNSMLRSDWNSLIKIVDAKAEYYELNENYRNTTNVVNYCNENLNTNMKAIGYDGLDVQVIDSLNVNQLIEHAREHDEAIIANDDNILDILKNKNIECYNVFDVKGLEFRNALIIDNDLTSNEKYVGYTRTLNNLTIVHEVSGYIKSDSDNEEKSVTNIKSFDNIKEEIINKANSKGYITYSEIEKSLNGLKLNEKAQDELYNDLKRAEIDIRMSDDKKKIITEMSDSEFKKEAYKLISLADKKWEIEYEVVENFMNAMNISEELKDKFYDELLNSDIVIKNDPLHRESNYDRKLKKLLEFIGDSKKINNTEYIDFVTTLSDNEDEQDKLYEDIVEHGIQIVDDEDEIIANDYESKKNALILKGKKRGYVTFNEMAEVLKGETLTAESLDRLNAAIRKAGINIRND